MEMLDNQTPQAIPSPLTPISVLFNEENFLVPRKRKTRNKCDGNVFNNLSFPYGIGIISCIQIIIHLCASSTVKMYLRFEPRKLSQLWRFFSYMFIHDDWIHLSLNLVMQCLFALFLESQQGSVRVSILYILAGITGVLGASCFHPDLVIGASAGVYALLISNIAHIALNFTNLKYRKTQISCVILTVIADIIYNVVHFYSKSEPQISWIAHLVGGMTGLLLGLVIFKSNKPLDNQSAIDSFINVLHWTGCIFYIFLLFFLVILICQIKKCTQFNVASVKYIYFC